MVPKRLLAIFERYFKIFLHVAMKQTQQLSKKTLLN